MAKVPCLNASAYDPFECEHAQPSTFQLIQANLRDVRKLTDKSAP